MTPNGLRSWARLLVTLWLLAVTSVGMADGGRFALVIGNSVYDEGALANPVNDATDFAAKLRGVGFQAELLLNADQQAMEQAIDTFTRALTGPGKVGLFYFAGHGIEYQGRNYLLPVGAVLHGAVDLRYKAVDAGRILDGMGESGNGLNMVVLDACRNNPFPSAFRSASRGLARLSPAKGTLVLYATQPGAVASDGDGRNGVFTKHLLSALDEPGLEVEQAFKRAALAVDQETGGAQTPWIEGVALGHFAFVPAASALPTIAPGPVTVAPPPPVQAGHLQVSVNTPAQVRIDDRYSGEATPERPLNLSNLPVGVHRITVSASGYRDGQQDTQIHAGRWTQELLRLSPEQAQAPPPALLPQTLSAVDTFQTYSNSRFDYSIDYPADLLSPQGEAPNGDGHIFASSDQEARMIIYGTHNVLDQTIKDLFQQESKDASSHKIIKKVTYKRQKNNWFVISGYIGPKIFYQKTFLSKDMFKTFYIEYPQNQRQRYDPILSRLGSSFKG
ncbi:MAG: caspase family protein [Chromatiaceae bacterium]